jgi:K+ potassium transporter
MARALSEASVSNSGAHTGRSTRADFWALTLGSIGVVYGDIGTSHFTLCVSQSWRRAGAKTASGEIILGILSLIIWALVLVVTVKYVLLLLRADSEVKVAHFAPLGTEPARIRRVLKDVEGGSRHRPLHSLFNRKACRGAAMAPASRSTCPPRFSLSCSPMLTGSQLASASCSMARSLAPCMRL